MASLPATVHGDAAPYSENSLFDNSPLKRPTKSFGPGQAWRIADKALQMDYGTGGSQVRNYEVKATGASSAVNYPAGSLLNKTTTNERGLSTIEYSDKNGQTVERWTPDSTSGQYLKTSYVYDDLGRLRYVVPPKAQTMNSFNQTDNAFLEGCYGYQYDERGRVIGKHVPGGSWTYMVYDALDRVVLQQDAQQATTNRWSFSKYDALGRPILRGEATNTSSQSSLQADFKNVATAYEVWQSGNYSSQSYPSSFGYSPADVRSMSYYDQYDWPPSGMAFDAGNAYHQQYGRTTGLATGQQNRHSENQSWLFSSFYYDDKSRLIQSFAHNLYGQIERTDLAYNFAGEITKQRQIHKDQNGNSTPQLFEYEYDHVGRKTACYQTINAATRDKIAAYTYDAVGRLSQKRIMPDGTYSIGGVPASIVRPPNASPNTQDVATQFICLQPGFEINANGNNPYLAQISTSGGGASINGLQTIDYQYHIRGWLRGINSPQPPGGGLNAAEGDLFSYKLDYETAGWFDGNIGKQSWNSSTGERNYVYSYDAASRLKSATYTGLNGENYSIPNMSYDANGNITNLQRNGKTGGGFGPMDNLTYSYNGNRLSQITDGLGGSHEVDFVQRGGANYTFYNDGSLKSDANEQIANINYDTFLQQPTQVQLIDGRTINHYYDGGGKLLKTIYSNGEYWDFGNGLIYKNGQPYQMSTPEGRAIYTPWGRGALAK